MLLCSKYVGDGHFLELRAVMYVVRTAISAMTVAINTAAVGQSMVCSSQSDIDECQRHLEIEVMRLWPA